MAESEMGRVCGSPADTGDQERPWDAVHARGSEGDIWSGESAHSEAKGPRQARDKAGAPAGGASKARVARGQAASQDATVKPVLAIGLGRGKVGKSTLLAWACWRAEHNGRGGDLLIADFDHRSETLGGLFGDRTIKVNGGNLAASKKALSELLVQMVEEGRSAVADFGTGDDLLTHLGQDLPVEEFCDEHGIEPLPLFCMGAEEEDLRHAIAIWRSDYFRPERAVLVLNEGKDHVGEDGLKALLRVQEDPAFQRMSEAAPSVLMNHLSCMPQCLAHGGGFYRAMNGVPGTDGSKLHLWNRGVVKKWVTNLEAECVPFADRLP
jgi:hypothetical protein